MRPRNNEGQFIDQDFTTRFWSKVKKGADNECWEWTGFRNPKGYGMIGLNGKVVVAHRISYETSVGPIPEGKQIDHLCRNRGCVNPKHLEPVTNQENTRRGLTGKINHRNSRKTHCPKGHLLEGDNLVPYYLNIGRRVCRICRTDYQAVYRSHNNTV